MQALFLGAPISLTARPLWEWLEAGNRVSEFWVSRDTSERVWARDRVFARLCPGWSVTAALRRFSISVREVGPLRKDKSLQAIACKRSCDAVISSCFPYVVPTSILEHYGPAAVNLHPALLPRYRGPAPIAAMLYHGDGDTAGGVTLHRMALELDEGPVIAARSTPWSRSRTFRHWEAQLAATAGTLVRDELPRYLAGDLVATPQQGEGSYHRGVSTDRLSLNGDVSADRADYLCRALHVIQPPHVVVKDRPRKVVALARTLGPPTGQPTRMNLLAIETDLKDARARFRRRLPGASKLLYARRLAEYLKTPYSDTAVSQPPVRPQAA